MKILMTSDLHFTDKKDDQYRWRLVGFLVDLIQKENIDTVFILGDLTIAKDNHSSFLVNSIMAFLRVLSTNAEVCILKGNHDYIDPQWSFFKFLNFSKSGNIVRFIDDISLLDVGEIKVCFLPHTFTPNDDWKEITKGLISKADVTVMHQTVNGSIASNGQKLDGELITKFFRKIKHGKIYSGDIHVPQKVGPVTYVGSPYPVYFGDKYQGRVLILDTDTMEEKSIDYKSIRKETIEITKLKQLRDAGFNEDDQIKIKFKIKDNNIGKWPSMYKKIKHYCKKKGIKFYGASLMREDVSDNLSSKTKHISNKNEADIKDLISDYASRKGKSESIVKIGNDIVKQVR